MERIFAENSWARYWVSRFTSFLWNLRKCVTTRLPRQHQTTDWRKYEKSMKKPRDSDDYFGIDALKKKFLLEKIHN